MNPIMKKLFGIMLFMALACAVSARTLYVDYTTADGSEYSTEVTERNGKFVLDIDNLATITFNLSEYRLVDEEVSFEIFDNENIGRKLKPYRQSMMVNIGTTSLPNPGDYHIEIAADMSYGIFMTSLTDRLMGGTPCYDGPIVANNKTVKREFEKISDTEYVLDCNGDNAIPAKKEFTIRIIDCDGDLRAGYNYGTSALTPTSGTSYWEDGKDTVLDEDFSGKIRLTRIDGSPGVVLVTLEP